MEEKFTFRTPAGNELVGTHWCIKGTNTRQRPVIFLHGYKRSHRESKFVELAEKLLRCGVESYGFDFVGCGDSRGVFEQQTIVTMCDQLRAFIASRSHDFPHGFHVFAHSLGACVIAELLKEKLFRVLCHRIVLLAPALNQRDLLRFWFVRDKFPKRSVTWRNYRSYLVEDLFAEWARPSAYRRQASTRDYAQQLRDVQANTLVIVGDKDVSVPVDSLGTELLPTRHVISDGDHDLETTGLLAKWLPHATKFLKDELLPL